MAEKHLNDNLKDEQPDIKKPMTSVPIANNLVTLPNIAPTVTQGQAKPLPHNGLSFEEDQKLKAAEGLTSYMPICVKCDGNAYVIEDYQLGCIVCTQCGSQIGGALIASGAEWRVFADDGTKANADPSRVGGVDDEFEGLGTTISGTSALANRHAQVTLSTRTRALRNVIDYCKNITIRLQLGTKILDIAKEICKTVIESPDKGAKGTKNINYHSLAAVSVYEACKYVQQPRKREEILCVSDNVSNPAFNKQLTRVRDILKKSNKLRPPQEITAVSYIERYVKELCLPYFIADPAKCIATAAKQHDVIVSSNDSAIAGATVYFTALLAGQQIDLAKVSKVCVTAPATLSDIARSLHSQRKRVVPDNFVNPVVVEKMLRP